MNWEAIGAIGEIASAAGVIITLIYLATQIRIQNSESKSRNISEISSQWNNFLGDLATNYELANAWKIGLVDFSALDEVPKVQLSAHLSRVFKTIEGFHQQWLAGNLSDDTWTALGNATTDICQYPGVKTWWDLRRSWYAKQFQDYVATCIRADMKPNIYGEHNAHNVQNET
ncbi:MAG: hypothetical protein R3E64_09500 [Halioglobus sp.]